MKKIILLIVVTFFACAKPRLIPNTKIIDNKTNRNILSVVEDYRKAMESIDAPAVLILVHPTYTDNSGTPDADDDMDYSGVKELLSKRFKNASKVKMQIEFQHAEIKGREAIVDTWIDATFVYHKKGSKPQWRRFADYNRFKLLKEGKRWLFIGGL